jgi:aryl-alcohol dehydrogenase-like predicted oxidoreductase
MNRQNVMQYATLGHTGLLVSRLCFGTMTFGDGRGLITGIGAVGQAEADELVKTSIDGGINFFDTADTYTEGESEKILGQSLKNLNIARKDVVIATKVYGRVGPGRNDIGASRGHIMDGVEASLRRLQTDHIDLYQIHGNDSVTPVDETIRALDTLVQQGKVRYVGCSNWQAWKIAKALGICEFRNLARFDTLQAYYSIAGRDLEREIVPLLESEKIGLLVWSPLAGGLLSGKFSRTSQKPADSRRTGLRLSHRGQRADLEDPRRDSSDRESPWMQCRTCLARMAPGEASGNFDHHRRQAPRSASGQSSGGRTHTHPGRA